MIKTTMADDLLPLLGLGPNNGGDDDSDNSSDSSHEMEAVSEEKVTEKKKEKRKKTLFSSNITFDTSLPSSHSYLGNDLEELRGRTILDDNAVVTMPLLTMPGLILVPGQVIPLHLFHPHIVAMIRNIIDNDKTFGVVATRMSSTDYSTSLAGIGTTAEIYSVKTETDDASGISTIRVKARGRQRFELLDYRRAAGSVHHVNILMGKVKILPDVELEDVFEGARPLSHCKLCLKQKNDHDDVQTAVDGKGNVLSNVHISRKLGRVNRFTAANYTWWPPWVYKMYDPGVLIKRVKDELQSWNDTLNPDHMPDNVTELSYWVTQNLPLDDSLRLHLLTINNSIQRLRASLSMINKYSLLCCRECAVPIADKNDVFSLAVEGPLGAYVNPGGHVHETLTVYKANNLNLIGRPSTEHSWFPGYAWTIAQCRNCAHHMGWRFTTKNKELIPQKFYGLCRSSLIPGLSNSEELEDMDEFFPII